MRSSYIQNNYGDVFFAIIRAFQPINCVEIGVLDGYSTMHIARGLEANKRGELTAIDLFEEYKFNHGNVSEVKEQLDEYGLLQYVKLRQDDAFIAHNSFEPGTVDFLHVDLSNTGATVAHIMSHWDEKMVQGGVICFEGGTEERDNIDWMLKYNMPSIKKALDTNEIIIKNYVFGTYLKFPGLTMLIKKR